MQTRKVLESLLTTILSKKLLYIAPYIVRIFCHKSRTRRTIGSHQIRVFHRRSEQLVAREARRKLKAALAHVLGAKASLEAALTVDKHRPSRVTVVGLRCRSPKIKVSIKTFLSTLQPSQSSDRCWMTEIRSRDTDSIGLIWVVDPVANDWRLMKSIDPWASAGGPSPRCRGHILQIFS
jgi:hypothetical protein